MSSKYRKWCILNVVKLFSNSNGIGLRSLGIFRESSSSGNISSEYFSFFFSKWGIAVQYRRRCIFLTLFVSVSFSLFFGTKYNLCVFISSASNQEVLEKILAIFLYIYKKSPKFRSRTNNFILVWILSDMNKHI